MAFGAIDQLNRFAAPGEQQEEWIPEVRGNLLLLLRPYSRYCLREDPDCSQSNMGLRPLALVFIKELKAGAAESKQHLQISLSS